MRISRIGLCVFVLTAVGAAAANGETPQLSSPLTPAADQPTGGVTYLDVNDALYAQLRTMRDVVLTDLPLGDGVVVSLDLNRYTPFLSDAEILFDNRPGHRGDISLLRGTVIGDPGSHAMLALSPYGTYGMVTFGGEMHLISSGKFGSHSQPVVFNMETVPEDVVNIAPFNCGTEGFRSKRLRRSDGRGFTTRGQPCREVTVAVETDIDYTMGLFGGDTGAAMAWMELLYAAQADIYIDQLNVDVTIAFARLWTESDPWTHADGWDFIDQLFEYQDFWNANMTHVYRNMVNFISSRPLGGGVAYVYGLCYPMYDYQYSGHLDGSFPYPVQDQHWDNWDVMVVAHENGHLFGAFHTHDMVPPIDGCGLGDCSVAPNGTIMSYCHGCPGGLENVKLEFHERIKVEGILPYLNGVPIDGESIYCNMETPCGCRADMDQDGDADVDDVTMFLAEYAAGNMALDYNHDGVLNGRDVGVWLRWFWMGC